MIHEATKTVREALEETKHIVGFVPFRLELKNFPQYDNFPYNIAFMGYATINGEDISGDVLYYPDFSTYQEKEGKQSMTYFNQYSRDWTVEIIYDKEKNGWEGWKYYKGELKGGGEGRDDWRMTFAHITMGGVAKGEPAQFEKREMEKITENT